MTLVSSDYCGSIAGEQADAGSAAECSFLDWLDAYTRREADSSYHDDLRAAFDAGRQSIRDEHTFASGFIIKPERDRDLYVRWDEIAGEPAWIGTSAQARAKGCHLLRLQRADKAGTSGMVAEWDDDGINVAALGVLPRDRIAAYAVAWCDGRRDEARAMLEPFEDEVKR